MERRPPDTLDPGNVQVVLDRSRRAEVVSRAAHVPDIRYGIGWSDRLLHPTAAVGVVKAGAGLEDDYGVTTFGEPCRENRPGRAGADDADIR